MKNNFGNVMKGAIILSGASFIAKILSAMYRIPFENMVGNLGFYVYQQVYPIYAIGMTFSLSGFPVFISKIIAEQDDMESKYQISKRIFNVLVVLTILCFLFLQLGSTQIAEAMGDIKLEVIIRSVSWMFLLMPFLSVGRGFYQGIFNMTPTAVSQVYEQLIRVIVIIGVAWYAVRHHWSIYKMGAWAMFSSTLGGLVALLCFVGIFIRLFSRKYHKHSINYRDLVKRLMTEGIMICLFTALMVLLQLIDSFTIKNNLEIYGLSSIKASNIKGIYDRAQPLIQLGLVIGVSFSSTLLPSLTAAIEKKEKTIFENTASSILRISLGIASAATVGLLALLPEVNKLLFGDSELSLVIGIYLLGIILMTVINSYSSILQSIDEYKVLLIGLGVAFLTKYILNSYLIGKVGIIGASIATTASLLLATIIIILFSSIKLEILFRSDGYVLKLLLISCIMGIVVKGLSILLGYLLESSRLDVGIISVICIPVGVFIFGILAIKFNLFTKEEYMAMPGGNKIIKIIDKLNGGR
ncbi:putative polysaccharide biosynthesis protein [Ligilactobacillus salivarius]|uniref:putative polysaccharide biosynthesis protein n=1 Tax=Ligilactobacillus salivarius TaxID=1624 RepID=UPI002964D51F|nr:oligosaccharide flippase family protein [Ligilactobacillus salivarius]WOX36324.1 oligosaccharide flippase family protein [Ligilactobacillus salivarius]